MPFPIACPTCRNVLLVHELQIGTVVQCGACRGVLTVAVPVVEALSSPGPVTEPEPEFSLPDDEPAPLRKPPKRGREFLFWLALWVACTTAIRFLIDPGPFFLSAGFAFVVVVLLAGGWYGTSACPRCGQRLQGFRWDNPRVDGGPDRRYKSNAKRCLGCRFALLQ